MPEGHLIHRFAVDHSSLFGGRLVHVSSPQGRFADAGHVDSRILQDVDAHGKHLFYVFDHDALVHVHLGLTGRFVIGDEEVIPWARLRIEAERNVLHLIAPSKCELMTSLEAKELVSRLGPDPLRADAAPARALEHIARSDAPIGSLMLDQSVIAGVGNVLRAEILFLIGVDPNAPGSSLGQRTLELLWRETVRVMKQACERGSIITRPGGGSISDSAVEKRGRFVYKQERCGRCGTEIHKWTLAGRTAYACPRCQA